MIVTVTYPLNKRKDQPATLPGNKVGTLKTGDTIDVETTEEGQFIEGNNIWLKDKNGFYYWSGATNYTTVAGGNNPPAQSPVEGPVIRNILSYAEKIVNMPVAWRQAGGAGITVAVIDSGIMPNHPGLQKALAKHSGLAKSFVDDNTNDIVGHGTLVAGLISSNTSDESGIMGVAPLCDIINLKTTNNAITTGNSLAAALDELFKISATTVVDVANMSFNISEDEYLNGKYSGGETIAQKIEKLITKNIIVVASAGNTDFLMLPTIFYPAMHSDVVSVGATNNKIAGSQLNSRVDFIFQNLPLRTTSKAGDFNGQIQKTSAYTAVLSGIVASLLSTGVLKGQTGRQKVAAVKSQLNSFSFSIDNFTDESPTGQIKTYKRI